MAVALFVYWYVRGYISEGRRWLEEIARHEGVENLPTTLQAELTGAAGSLASVQCDLDTGIHLLDKSLASARLAGDERITADTLRNLGTAEILRGNYARAENLLREVLALWGEKGERRRTAIALHNLAWISLFTGDYRQAEVLEDDAIPLFQDVGDKWHAGLALALKGLALCRRGQADHAEGVAKQVMADLEDLEGNNGALGLAITCLAEVAGYRGDSSVAKELYCASLKKEGGSGSFAPKVLNLVGLGSLAAMAGDAERATILFAALYSLGERLKATVITPSARPNYESGLAAAKSALEDPQWAQAWARGRAMSLDDIIAYALDEEVDPV